MGNDAEDSSGARTRPARWAAVLTRIELGFGALALVLMFVLVLVQAGQRYLPLGGWSWTGELAEYCLVWLTFTVAGVLVSRDSHISLQILDGIGNERILRGIRVFALLTVAVVGAGFAAEAWDLMTGQGHLRSPSLRMPLLWLYLLPFLGFVSTAVRAVVAAVDIARHGVPAAAEPGEGNTA